MTESFFDETTEQSAVKSAIVSKYFRAWAAVIKSVIKRRGGNMAYLDLFAGPGRYRDGADSTPLLVLKEAIADVDLSRMLITVFNDKDEENCQSLKHAIDQLPGIERLTHPPVLLNYEVGDQMVANLERVKLMPTLFFVDPWGYKGLSLQLVNSVVKDWGCDCIFFFNYNRVNMGLGNAAVIPHMNALFGTERAEALRRTVEALPARDRESAIIEELCDALNSTRDRFVLPFCFKNSIGTRTKHHLIFVSKNFRGYDIMKDIMARESSRKHLGTASFTYCPADREFPLLFDLSQPPENLATILLRDYAGQTLTFQNLYEQDSVGKPFVRPDYRRALTELEESDKIKAMKPDGRKRRKGTFPDDIVITFLA